MQGVSKIAGPGLKQFLSEASKRSGPCPATSVPCSTIGTGCPSCSIFTNATQASNQFASSGGFTKVVAGVKGWLSGFSAPSSSIPAIKVGLGGAKLGVNATAIGVGTVTVGGVVVGASTDEPKQINPPVTEIN